MGEKVRHDRRTVVAAVAGAGCISSSAILVQLAGQGAVTTALFRCLLALPVLGVLAVVEARRHGPRSLRARSGAVLAGAFLAIDLVLWNHSIADVGAGAATVLGNLQVVFVVVIAWAVLKERPGTRVLAALPVLGIGVVLVAGLLGRSSFGPHPLAGLAYGIGTSLAYAVFLLVLRNASSGARHVAGPVAEVTAGATVASLVIGSAVGTMSLSPPWPAIGWLLALAMVSQVAGWLLITSSLPRLPAAVSSLLLLLQPAAAMVLAAVVLSERPTPWQIAGAVLVCLGLLLAVGPSPGAAGGNAAGPVAAGPVAAATEKSAQRYERDPAVDLALDDLGRNAAGKTIRREMRQNR